MVLAVALLVLFGQPIGPASAAPAPAGLGRAIGDATPALVETVGWRRGYGGRGFYGRGYYGRGYYRPARFHRPVGFYRPVRYYRPYRVYRPYRPVRYWGGGYYGARCFVRPARYVATPYGWVFRPARRVCRY
jgi:hypothetical protein